MPGDLLSRWVDVAVGPAGFVIFLRGPILDPNLDPILDPNFENSVDPIVGPIVDPIVDPILFLQGKP